MPKSTVDEIRARFDRDVERFSNLDTGQAATIDALLVMDLITDAAAMLTPCAKAVLDVGCGAGNYTVKLLQKLPAFEATLVDLSQPMLDRATAHVTEAGATRVTALQGDIRNLDCPEGTFDVVIAAAVLHHLRGDDEWSSVFAKFHRCLRPGGSIWISDLVEHTTPGVQQMMWRRYGEYLVSLKGQDYRDEVFAYVDREDTPRPLWFQLNTLGRVGFSHIELLHKNGPFAAFGAIKSL